MLLFMGAVADDAELEAMTMRWATNTLLHDVLAGMHQRDHLRWARLEKEI
jgi:hypothetical protein